MQLAGRRGKPALAHERAQERGVVGEPDRRAACRNGGERAADGRRGLPHHRVEPAVHQTERLVVAIIDLGDGHHARG